MNARLAEAMSLRDEYLKRLASQEPDDPDAIRVLDALSRMSKVTLGSPEKRTDVELLYALLIRDAMDLLRQIKRPLPDRDGIVDVDKVIRDGRLERGR